jgi:hypothetical protein
MESTTPTRRDLLSRIFPMTSAGLIAAVATGKIAFGSPTLPTVPNAPNAPYRIWRIHQGIYRVWLTLQPQTELERVHTEVKDLINFVLDAINKTSKNSGIEWKLYEHEGHVLFPRAELDEIVDGEKVYVDCDLFLLYSRIS